MLSQEQTLQISAINEALQPAFVALSNSSYADPKQRHNLFDRTAFTHSGLHPIPGLVNNAVRDAAIVAFSAFNFCVSTGNRKPSNTTLVSIGLLSMAELPQSAERNFQDTFSLKLQSSITPNTLETTYLTYNSDKTAVELGLEAKQYVEAHIVQGRGCPARGRILSVFYDRYVRAIFAHQLDVEAAIK